MRLRCAVRRLYTLALAGNGMPALKHQLRARQGIKTAAGKLKAAGVDLYLDRQVVDTTTPAGMALLQMLGVFAELERSIIQPDSVFFGLF